MKKISEFNKAELLEHMKASGEIHRYDHESKAWRRAFDLYAVEQGQRLDMDCSRCKGKVTDWLTK